MSGCLIAPAALAQLLDARTVTVLDVRWTLGGPPSKPEYLRGHIPTARFVELDRELSAPPGPRGRHPLPDADAFGAAMRSHGVFADRPVVVYDAGETVPAARAWWLLRFFGHPRAVVLDGGLRAWEAAGLPLSTEVPAAPEGDFVSRPGHLPLLDAPGAARMAVDGLLLDARAGERYRGDVEPVDPVAGHIPGAVNLPAADLTGPAGWQGARQLLARLRAAGVPEDSEIGAYCGSGVSAAALVLAGEEAGRRVALYPGSWSEWVADPARPVATGA